MKSFLTIPLPEGSLKADPPSFSKFNPNMFRLPQGSFPAACWELAPSFCPARKSHQSRFGRGESTQKAALSRHRKKDPWPWPKILTQERPRKNSWRPWGPPNRGGIAWCTTHKKMVSWQKRRGRVMGVGRSEKSHSAERKGSQDQGPGPGLLKTTGGGGEGGVHWLERKLVGRNASPSSSVSIEHFSQHIERERGLPKSAAETAPPPKKHGRGSVGLDGPGRGHWGKRRKGVMRGGRPRPIRSRGVCAGPPSSSMAAGAGTQYDRPESVAVSWQKNNE